MSSALITIFTTHFFVITFCNYDLWYVVRCQSCFWVIKVHVYAHHRGKIYYTLAMKRSKSLKSYCVLLETTYKNPRKGKCKGINLSFNHFQDRPQSQKEWAKDQKQNKQTKRRKSRGKKNEREGNGQEASKTEKGWRRRLRRKIERNTKGIW